MLIELDGKTVGLETIFVLLCLFKKEKKSERADGAFKEKGKQTELSKEGERYFSICDSD